MTISGFRNLSFLFTIGIILIGYTMLTESSSKVPADHLLDDEPLYSVSPSISPAEREHALGRGINIGNALEAPKGEFWGVEMKKEYFDIIKNAGFDTVRLPVRFSDYTSDSSNGYKLEEGFLALVDSYIDHGLSLGLNIILDLHHYDQIMDNPAAEYEKLSAIWHQLSKRYSSHPAGLVFEILNEPQNNLGGEIWNQYAQDIIAKIRETNPDRLIIVGSDQFSSPDGLESLSLPKDSNIMVTFHYYSPTEFAFQGNSHHFGYEALTNITWCPGEDELANIHDDFERVSNWAKQNNVKVLLGEFGSVNTIPFEYRGEWTRAVVNTAEQFGFSWCYWELCSWFGIMDSTTMLWDYDMLKILLP